MSTPAGWYPDPEDSAQSRYWDGNAWTEQRSPASPPPAPPAPPSPSAPPTPVGWSTPPAQLPNKPNVAMGWFSRQSPRMKAGLVIGVAVLLVAIGASASGGGVDDESATNAPPKSRQVDNDGDEERPTTTRQTTTTVTTTTTTTPPTTTTIAAPIAVSGRGDSVIAATPASGAGTAGLLYLTHSGSSNFAVWALDVNNERLDLVVNEIGRYTGVVPLGFSESPASLQISADGAWTVEFRSLWSAPQVNKQVLTGAGSGVYLYIGGAGTATINAPADTNFVVRSYSAGSAASADLLVNEIGPYSGVVPVRDGVQIIEVMAEGDWSIAFA